MGERYRAFADCEETVDCAKHPEMTTEVEHYYDANTRSFRATGQGRDSIHRAVWLSDVANRDEAFHVVEARIAEALRERTVPARVVDLGCGVGASLLWLRDRVAFSGIGITLSGEQARAAKGLLVKYADVRVVQGSYTELPAEVDEVDLAFAIESFVHSPSVDAFVRPIAERLKLGGTLWVADDFLGRVDASNAELIADVRWGWLANSLVSVAVFEATARRYGLRCIGNEDFTDSLELGRLRDRLLAAVVTVGRPFVRQNWLFRSWVGGTALQRALKRRAVEFRLLRFVKTEETPEGPQ